MIHYFLLVYGELVYKIYNKKVQISQSVLISFNWPAKMTLNDKVKVHIKGKGLPNICQKKRRDRKKVSKQ